MLTDSSHARLLLWLAGWHGDNEPRMDGWLGLGLGRVIHSEQLLLFRSLYILYSHNLAILLAIPQTGGGGGVTYLFDGIVFLSSETATRGCGRNRTGDAS